MNDIKRNHAINGFDRLLLARQIRGARALIRALGDSTAAYTSGYMQHYRDGYMRYHRAGVRARAAKAARS